MINKQWAHGCERKLIIAVKSNISKYGEDYLDLFLSFKKPIYMLNCCAKNTGTHAITPL